MGCSDDYIGTTFLMATLAWIFFRAGSINQAFSYIEKIFDKSLFTVPEGSGMKIILPLLLFFIIVEWLGRRQEYAIEHLSIRINKPLRWVIYYAIIFLIVWFSGKEQQFIYLQF